MELTGLVGTPLSVPLEEPFVIASGALTTTRSVLVRVRLNDGQAEEEGIGEAAALPPVTACDQPELMHDLGAARDALTGLRVGSVHDLARALARLVPSPVLRAGIESAALDGWGKLERKPACALFARGAVARTFVTDVTIPIAEPVHMAELARRHRRAGFDVFKVKVGRNLDDDVNALRAIAAAVPEARLRIDANGGYDLAGARALLRDCAALTIDCFEQPCARGNEDAMAELARETDIPVIADESLRSADDLERIIALSAADAVNLKLAKLGGLLEAFAIGARAREAGLDIMCGAMVETRLGLTAMMHVAAALGGARFVDLDTQLLLAEEPFAGGYSHDGPRMELSSAPGLGIAAREHTHGAAR